MEGMRTATNNHNTLGISHTLCMFSGLLEEVIPSQGFRNGGIPSSQSGGYNEVVIRLGDGRFGRGIRDMCDLGGTIYLADAALDDFEIRRFECRDILESSPGLCCQLLTSQRLGRPNEMVWSDALAGYSCLLGLLVCLQYPSRSSTMVV